MSSKRGSFAKNLKLDHDFSEVLDGGKDVAEKNQWFFEVAWEVANQGQTRH